MPPKMRVEKGMIRASRSFHGIDPELQVSSEPLPVAADAGGADIIIPTAGGAPSAPSAPEDAIPGPVDGDWEPTLRAFFKQYAPAKTGEVRLCTSRRPPSGMTLRPPSLLLAGARVPRALEGARGEDDGDAQPQVSQAVLRRRRGGGENQMGERARAAIETRARARGAGALCLLVFASSAPLVANAPLSPFPIRYDIANVSSTRWRGPRTRLRTGTLRRSISFYS